MREIFAMQARAWRLWIATLESQTNACTTIAMRMPGLLRERASGGDASPESRRMVEEKVAAAQQGAISAARASSKFAAKAMVGRMTGVKFASGVLDIADAAMHPARKTVRKNARRLTGRSINP